MSRDQPTIAVTGLNATDNPGPGVSVIRSLRADPKFDGRIVGFAYDALEPGIFAADVADDVFLIPYPSQGLDTLETRLRYINERVGGIDVLIPTLDSELPSFIALEPVLAELGIACFMPTKEQYDLRSKVYLADLGEKADISVPKSKVINDISALYDLHQEVPFPVYIKGLFYGATLARSVDEAVHAFHRVAAQWGLPIIVQQALIGDELDVVAVGDGEGGLVGAVPMKKTFITDKGKGWAGITIRDPELHEVVEKFMAATKWRGPCEVEVLKSHDGGYHLLEVNPRFPAWTYLSAGAGMNLPAAVVDLALGKKPQLDDYRVGTLFVRISLDQIATLEDFQKMTQAGELSRHDGENK